MRADYTATLFTKKCRNATRNDRHTFCEVKKGKTYQFALLGHLLEEQGFFNLAPEYQVSITDSVFESTRALRDGKRHEVVEYAGGAPFQLWVINRAIEGVAASIQWETTTTQRECPRWDRPGN